MVDLARRTQRRLMVRLVKGAYWDSEIKRAQVDGLDGLPVYTRKVHTDISYIACAKSCWRPEAVYPQFATHNAETLATIYHLAGSNYYAGQYEFQCLHGMGEPLYEQVVGAITAGKGGPPCRIYAPVGTHETLLAYLVRRLLENGANTSFVNRIADETIALDELVKSPVQVVDEQAANRRHCGLPTRASPASGAVWRPPQQLTRAGFVERKHADRAGRHAASHGKPRLGGSALLAADVPAGTTQPVRNPADHNDVVGQVQEATTADVTRPWPTPSQAAAAPGPPRHPPSARRPAAHRRPAGRAHAAPAGLLMREAGKSASNAVAGCARRWTFALLRRPGAKRPSTTPPTSRWARWPASAPGTSRSPSSWARWPPPGRRQPVLAKPAEQTPLIAAEAVRLLWQAGVPARRAAAARPGRNRGRAPDWRCARDGRDVHRLHRSRPHPAAHRGRAPGCRRPPIPLIAETGGQNAMIVDSSALAEQVVGDAVSSV